MTTKVNTGPKCFSVAQVSEDNLGACVAFTCWSDDVREGDERVKRLHKFLGLPTALLTKCMIETDHEF